MKTISQTEKTDILLALAMTFDKRLEKGATGGKPTAVSALVEKIFGVLPPEDFRALRDKAAAFDDLSGEKRDRWSEIQIENIRRRGKSKRLDENINPSHLVEILIREPRAVQFLILRNLPPDLSRRIALYLDLNFLPDDKSNGAKIRDDIVKLVRDRFLSNFIALEDLTEPDDLDRFSLDRMENFIRHLGLREIAIACRGISSKETLAAFLNRFDEEDAREIALYITELDKIRAFWVAQADELVRKSWRADLPPAKVVKKIGFKLLATTFIFREQTNCDYAAQKLSIREVKNWQRLLSVGKKKYAAAGADEKLRIEKRRAIVERLALKFAETGKL